MSILESRGPSLLPGEDHVQLIRDSYYGEVEAASVQMAAESPRARGSRVQREVRAGIALLDGTEQNRVEVLTGLRLQQRNGPKREDLPPTDLPTPTVTALEPNTAALGSPNFDLHVKGTGFVDGSVIVFAGQDEPTTLVSDTEVTTGVNMAVWLGPDPAIKVSVRNPDDQMSNEMLFAFTDAGTRSAESSSKLAEKNDKAKRP